MKKGMGKMTKSLPENLINELLSSKFTWTDFRYQKIQTSKPEQIGFFSFLGTTRVTAVVTISFPLKKDLGTECKNKIGTD